MSVVAVLVHMIRIGQEAPDFTLPGAAAGTIETHGLSEYTDRGWAVVLVFLPLRFSPGMYRSVVFLTRR
jgi:peroxiredoxin